MARDYDFAQLRRQLDSDGAIHVPGLLDDEQIAEAYAAFRWSMDNPGPLLSTFPDDPHSKEDRCNPAAYDAYLPMLRRSPLPGFIARLWEADPIWFMFEQVFSKGRGGGRSRWHQDTPYMPIDGPHVIVSWMAFEPQSREQALEFCAASHKGPLYDGVSLEAADTLAPYYDSAQYPILPDIEAEREKWPIVGWATEPGDVVLFHPTMLHGGGAPGELGSRQTLSLRFFGERSYYQKRPGDVAAPKVPGLDEMLKQGEPFRHPIFPKLH